MHRIIFLFLLISPFTFSQEMKLIKATKQTVNSGASPTSTTNYTIQFKKSKRCALTIDSVVNVYTQRTSQFNIFMVANSTMVLATPLEYRSPTITDRGIFDLNFSSMKNRGSGRPGTPMNLMVPIADFTQGAVVYYRVGKKKKQLIVESFDELETINAP